MLSCFTQYLQFNSILRRKKNNNPFYLLGAKSAFKHYEGIFEILKHES